MGFILRGRSLLGVDPPLCQIDLFCKTGVYTTIIFFWFRELFLQIFGIYVLNVQRIKM